MLNISQAIDGFAIDVSSSCQPSNLPEQKSIIGGTGCQHPVQLPLPHFASIQFSEISAVRKEKRSQERTKLRQRAQQFSFDQQQLCFQFFGRNFAIGSEK